MQASPIARGPGNPSRMVAGNVPNPMTSAEYKRLVRVEVKLDHMIARRIKLNQVNEAFEELKRGETARSVIMFDA